MTAERIAHELGGRRSGRGFIVRCPAHDDRSPSLSLTERDGKILVRCFAGCPQSDVIAALKSRGLWPERERRQWSETDHRQWAEQRRRDERDQIDAQSFADVAVILSEQVLGEISPTSPERRGLTRLVHALRGPSLLCEFREWKRTRPTMTAAMVHAGREHKQRIEIMLACFLRQGDSSNGATS